MTAWTREPTRLETHQSGCHGFRDYWHVLTGEHVRIATWDYREAAFLSERANERYVRALRAWLGVPYAGESIPVTPRASSAAADANNSPSSDSPGTTPE